MLSTGTIKYNLLKMRLISISQTAFNSHKINCLIKKIVSISEQPSHVNGKGKAVAVNAMQAYRSHRCTVPHIPNLSI